MDVENPIQIDVEDPGFKRKISRGPGLKSYKTARAAVVTSKKLTENLVRVIDKLLLENNNIEKKSIVIASIKSLC